MDTFDNILDNLISDIYNDRKFKRRDLAGIGDMIYDIAMDYVESTSVDDIDCLPKSDDEHEKYTSKYKQWLEDESVIDITSKTLRIQNSNINLVISVDTDMAYLKHPDGKRDELTISEFLKHMEEVAKNYPIDSTHAITNTWL